MITLQPFTPSDFTQFQEWIISEELLIQFASPIFSYPLTENQIHKYLENTKLKPFKVLFDGEYIGHCELNFMNDIPRLSRVLIGEESFRGKGLGREIIQNMLVLIFQNKEFTKADLNVFDWNQQAIKCYQKLGFETNLHETNEMIVNGEKWKTINMFIEKHTFLPR